MHEDIRSTLRAFILEKLLRTTGASLGDDEPLLTSGRLDSMSLAEIAAFVESEFGVRIPDTALTHERMDTLARIADTIEDYRDAAD